MKQREAFQLQAKLANDQFENYAERQPITEDDLDYGGFFDQSKLHKMLAETSYILIHEPMVSY